MNETRVNYVGGSFVVLLLLMLNACSIEIRFSEMNRKLERIAIALEKNK